MTWDEPINSWGGIEGNVAEKIPEDTLQEDNKLLMWYDQAITRTGA